jgi:isopentenyl-diphosphate delta-isomerase
MDDRLILVDLFDRECGYAEKLEVHQKGWLHRAFSIFLIKGSQMLIQKRAEHKYHSAGLWRIRAVHIPELTKSSILRCVDV